MTIFEKGKSAVISSQDDADLSKALYNKKLSAVDFDDNGKFFFMTIDRALFSDPVTAIRTVLDAHGFVANLENVLSCLDSFNFSAYARITGKNGSDSAPISVEEYLPCIRFELPQKSRVGPILRSFYDEIAKYESKAPTPRNDAWKSDAENRKLKKLAKENERLEVANKKLRDQINELTRQLSIEQKSLSRVSRALDSQQMLPANARIGRIETVDLKRRTVKVKCKRSVFDLPTHMMDRVPDFQTRCLITFGEDDDMPLGIIFFSNEELVDLENRTAELLYVKGDTFKARDSMRNEFQIRAVNALESDTIKSLKRGAKVVIAIANGYVVRFSVLRASDSERLVNRVHEKFVVHDIARNQLLTRSVGNGQAR
jgi:hypothetical protein